jgi:hypothetical protein
MKLPKKIQKIWAAEVEDFGYAAICSEAEINYRTFKRAIQKGECKPYIYDTVNAALLRLRKKRTDKEKKLQIQDDLN